MIMTVVIGMICTNWIIPVLSNEMVKHHSPPMNTSNAGLSFSLAALFGLFGAPFWGKMAGPKFYPR